MSQIDEEAKAVVAALGTGGAEQRANQYLNTNNARLRALGAAILKQIYG
jgi:cysteine synthase